MFVQSVFVCSEQSLLTQDIIVTVLCIQMLSMMHQWTAKLPELMINIRICHHLPSMAGTVASDGITLQEILRRLMQRF